MVSGVGAIGMEHSGQKTAPTLSFDANVEDRALLADYARSASPDIFARVVERHSPMVYATCLRILGEQSAAEDATQATFFALVRKMRSLPPSTLLGPWLHHAARNAALELRRANTRRSRREKEAADMANTTSRRAHSEADAGMDPDLRGELDEALGTLPAAQRDAVLLRYFYGFSAQEAARQLRCPEETLHTRLTRAMQRLRERFGQRGTVTTCVALAVLLEQQAAHTVPAGLSASIMNVCAGKAAASAAVATTADVVLRSMALAKAKAAALTLAIALAVAVPTAYVGIQVLKSAAPAATPPASVTFAPVAPAQDAVPAVTATSRQAASAEPAALAQFDFEDGHTLPEWVGTLEAGPARAGNRGCIAGAYVEDSKLTRVRIGNNEQGLFTYRKGAVLEFDYWAGETVSVTSVYVWDRSQNISIGGYEDWSPVKGKWTHATVDLSKLHNQDVWLNEDSLVIDATIQTGEGGGQLYIDNFKVTVPQPKHISKP